MSRLTVDQSQQLDSLRALAALAVLLGHTYQTLLLPTLNVWFTVVVLCAQFAVMAFFVLSGFLIGKSVSNNIQKNTIFDIKRYAADRALRLYPPLLAAVLLMSLLSWLAPAVFPSGTHAFLHIEGASFVRSEFSTSIRDVWGALTFLNGLKVENPLVNSPLWSLSLEAWYYVLAAAIVLLRHKRGLSVFLIAVTVYVTRDSAVFFMLAPVWFAGFGLAFVHQRRAQMNNRLFGYAFGLASLAFIASTAYALYPQPAGNEVDYNKISLFRLVSGLWFACYLALILGGAARFPKWLHRQAGYSYTLYVIHFPIMLFALGMLQAYLYGNVLGSWLVSFAVVAISLAMSWLLSRWLENKALLSAVYGLAVNRRTV